ncbi:hypothetical protein HFP72_27390 [Nocardiopsis sp. ARC36]
MLQFFRNSSACVSLPEARKAYALVSFGMNSTDDVNAVAWVFDVPREKSVRV